MVNKKDHIKEMLWTRVVKAIPGVPKLQSGVRGAIEYLKNPILLLRRRALSMIKRINSNILLLSETDRQKEIMEVIRTQHRMTYDTTSRLTDPPDIQRQKIAYDLVCSGLNQLHDEITGYINNQANHGRENVELFYRAFLSACKNKTLADLTELLANLWKDLESIRKK